MVDHSPETRSRAPWTPIGAAGAVALALAGALALRGPESEQVLHAAVSGSANDLDGDGLPNALEVRLGTDVNLADSDGDGISDAEEVARHSDPADPAWLPETGAVAINLVPYVHAGVTRLVTVIYAGDGNLSTKPYSMGARIGHTLRQAPLYYFTKDATFSSQLGKVSGSKVMVVDSPLDPTLLERFPSISFYALITSNGKKVDAGVTDMALVDGVVVEYTKGGVISASLGRAGNAQVSTSFYGPVDADAPILEWTPGEICGQITAVAATMGPIVVEEVVSANCEPGWDSYCDPGCSATVGDTVERIDPVALING